MSVVGWSLDDFSFPSSRKMMQKVAIMGAASVLLLAATLLVTTNALPFTELLETVDGKTVSTQSLYKTGEPVRRYPPLG